MTVSDPFAGSRLKLERAWFHIEDLATQTYDYAHSAEIVFGEYDRSKRTREILFSPSPPNLLPCIIGDAVHNLRSTLDHLVCDIGEIRKKERKNKYKFPFADTETELDIAIKKNGFLELGQDLIDTIKSLKPYKGGNELLRGLHDLDIKDKHQLIIPVFFKSFAEMNASRHMADGFAQSFKQLASGFADYDVSIISSEPGISMATYADNNTVYVVPIETSEMPTISLFDKDQCFFGSSDDPMFYLRPTGGPLEFIFKSSPGLPFPGEPVLETLHNLADLVDEIVTLFAAKFGAGNSPAASV